MAKRIYPPLTPEQRARKLLQTKRWRARNKKHIRQYETGRRLIRYALARRRLKDNPLTRAKLVAYGAKWRPENQEYIREYYRAHLGDYTGNGKWSTRSAKARRAFQNWTRVLAANRRNDEAGQ